MKVIVGVDRLTVEPETSSDRVLLQYWRDREGQRVEIQWDAFTENIGGKVEEGLCLYVNFDLITEDQR